MMLRVKFACISCASLYTVVHLVQRARRKLVDKYESREKWGQGIFLLAG